jgi:hypothetical protein
MLACESASCKNGYPNRFPSRNTPQASSFTKHLCFVMVSTEWSTAAAGVITPVLKASWVFAYLTTWTPGHNKEGSRRKSFIICTRHQLLLRLLKQGQVSGESRGSSVSIISRLRAKRPGFDSRLRNFFTSHRVQTGSGVHPALHNGYRRQIGWGAKVTAHLYLVSWLRIPGVIPPILHTSPLCLDEAGTTVHYLLDEWDM